MEMGGSGFVVWVVGVVRLERHAHAQALVAEGVLAEGELIDPDLALHAVLEGVLGDAVAQAGVEEGADACELRLGGWGGRVCGWKVRSLAAGVGLRELEVEDALVAGPEVPVLHLSHLLQPRPKHELSTALGLEVFSSSCWEVSGEVHACVRGGVPVLMESRCGCMRRGRGKRLLVSPGHWSCESVPYSWQCCIDCSILKLLSATDRPLAFPSPSSLSSLSFFSSFSSFFSFSSSSRSGLQRMDNKEEDNWLPMQSNPEVMTGFLRELGMNAEAYAVQDLLSVEEWAQEMLGQPVLGLVFLYEINQLQRDFEKAEEGVLEKNLVTDNVFFMRQYAKNACGTIALFHVLLNNIYDYPDLVKEGSFLAKFAEESFGKTPAEVGEGFKLSKDLLQKHRESVKKGSTRVRSKVETHFIAFVEKDGFLYELDGRKKEPVNHGECAPERLAFMACLVIHRFMQRDPTNNKFTLLAIAARPEL